ncbi:uncharacterized protein At1g65710 isoform X1 [Raphanus sativus]|uniref:Uncharacterized protein At1g65710 isoform X1 n=1 Tax=Raphanus sativus TaxID=3726 RepID=A0A6J0MZ64_RAPSA|nr:uncharacterized protein At1g65710 isoform X1 [Raphanus sativus]
MGCCLSKKTSPSSSSPSGVSPDPNKSAIDNKPPKAETEAEEAKVEVEESRPKNEAEIQENSNNQRKEVFVIKHRRSHERSKTTTDPEDSTASEEKSTGTNQTPAEVDAILIQCGRLSRSNSAAAAKTRRYSGSKRSFDFDKNGGDAAADEADAEDGGEEEEAERRIHRQRQRGGGGGESPRERRRRTPSREREDSKSYRSGSRERGSGGGSRRVSRSPGRRSETNPNSCAGSGSSVNSSNNNRPAKFVSVPATEKSNNNNNIEASIKRVIVKRNVASPRSQSPARAASPRAQSPARAAVNASSNAQPSPSKLRRKTEHSPYRRNPLGEIDPNSLAYPQPPHGNTNCNKKMINESANLEGQKVNAKTTIRRSASPSRVTKEQQEAVEECKIVVVSGTEIPKPPLIMSRSRSLRKSRDFDFSPEALLSNNIDNNAPASYAALLLEDIQNFHQKSVNVNAISSSVSKACAVSDLNSTTNKHQRTEVNSFASAAVKKADLMEPSFEKYVTVKRGGSSMEDMEEQESSGSNSVTGSSCVVQRKGGYSASSSWEPNSAESTDRMSGRSSSNKERDRSPFGVQEFDPLKKNGVGAAGGKRVATTTRVATVSV